MLDPKQQYHLEPLWTRDRALVPEGTMSAEEVLRKRTELKTLGVETRRPFPVGKSPCRDAHGCRWQPASLRPRRPVERFGGDDE